LQSVALAILELGDKLLIETAWTLAAPIMPVLRAAIATIASYVFFNRGECSACALLRYLVVSNTRITLLPQREKGRKGVNAGYMKVRQIASNESPRIAALLKAFFKEQAYMARPRDSLARRWSISPREDVEMWSALTLTEWLRVAYTTTGHLPPEDFNWNSHNLRNGVASAANAIGARLTDIRYQGGWTTNSNVLEAEYIDFTMHPSGPARLFFGYLYKGIPC
jgi:hypothetical protein